MCDKDKQDMIAMTCPKCQMYDSDNDADRQCGNCGFHFDCCI